MNFDIIIDNNGKTWYVLKEKIVYRSRRYNKFCTVESSFKSDGASGPATDIVSEGWWVHDKLCQTYRWDDGSYCSSWQSSMVLHDILKSEGRWFRAKTWGIFTFVWQCIRASKDTRNVLTVTK